MGGGSTNLNSLPLLPVPVPLVHHHFPLPLVPNVPPRLACTAPPWLLSLSLLSLFSHFFFFFFFFFFRLSDQSLLDSSDGRAGGGGGGGGAGAVGAAGAAATASRCSTYAICGETHVQKTEKKIFTPRVNVLNLILWTAKLIDILSINGRNY